MITVNSIPVLLGLTPISLPDTLKPGNGTPDRYQPIQLEDLSSLTKLTYGFEENPFPLFLFPHNDKWLIGVFMNFTEEGTSYFCHVVLDVEPKKRFMNRYLFKNHFKLFYFFHYTIGNNVWILYCNYQCKSFEG